jgi:VanZ family protein
VSDTGARLGFALLAYMLGVTLIITLLPFEFTWPDVWRISDIVDVVDMVANVLLFVPLGFFYALARHARRSPAVHALLLGAAVSLAIEAVQLFEIERQSSPVDVAVNALGAWLGAIAGTRVARAAMVEGRLVGWLALELPHMGLIYLMVPLLWIDALSTGADAVRRAAPFLLGVTGAILLGGMQRYYFGPWRASEPSRTAAFAVLWFLAGTFPSLAARPFHVVAGAALVALLVWGLGRRSVGRSAANRRYEVPLLKSTAPAYVAYLALIAAAPLSEGVGAWSVAIGFTGVGSKQIEILRLLELAAGFTLLGYMIAEFGGRAIRSYRVALPRLVSWSVAAAVAVEAIRGFHEDYGASILRAGLVVAAALYGGWLYHLQRAHVVRLVSQRSASRRA